MRKTGIMTWVSDVLEVFATTPELPNRHVVVLTLAELGYRSSVDGAMIWSDDEALVGWPAKVPLGVRSLTLRRDTQHKSEALVFVLIASKVKSPAAIADRMAATAAYPGVSAACQFGLKTAHSYLNR